MSKTPAQRFSSALEFRDDLQRWLDGLPVLARPVGMIGRFRRWKARNPTIANLALVVASLLLLLVVVWGRFTLDLADATNKLSTRNRDLHDSNRLLQKANERSDKERSNALQQADRANRQANLSFRVLNRLTFGLQNALADRPDVQQQLLNATIDDLEQLSSEVATDSAVSVTLAVAYVRLGETSWKAGSQAAAKQCFDRAQQTLDSLSAEYQIEPDVRQCRVWLHLSRGDVADDSGDQSVACNHFRRAELLCQEIEAASSDRVATMHAHALANIRFVKCECSDGDDSGTDEESDYISEAIRLLADCVKLNAAAEDIRYDLAAARLQRARMLKDTQPAQATDDALHAVDLLATIANDSQLRVQATRHAIDALAFVASRSRILNVVQNTQLNRHRQRIANIVDELQAQKKIEAQAAIDWRDKLHNH